MVAFKMFSLVFFNGSFECRVIWFLQLLELMSLWTRDRRGCWKSNWGRDVTLRLLLMHMHVTSMLIICYQQWKEKLIRSSSCRGHSHALGTGLPASSSASKINILHSNSFWKKFPAVRFERRIYHMIAFSRWLVWSTYCHFNGMLIFFVWMPQYVNRGKRVFCKYSILRKRRKRICHCMEDVFSKPYAICDD